MSKETEQVERSMSRKEFCAAEGISLSFYYNNLKPKGLAPKEMNVPGSDMIRISPEARREYHRKLEAFAETQQAKLEADRRRELARSASLRAVQSPNHVSNRNRGKRKRG